MSMSVESVFYEEARKRLAEMFSSDGQNGVSSPRQVSKSLGRILSLPGYNSSSPRFSPGRDEVDSPCLMRSSLLQKIIQSDSTSNFSPSHSIESSSYSDNNLDSGPHVINSSQSLIDHAALIPEIQQLSFEECGDSQLILTSTVLESNLRTYMEDLEAMLKNVRSVQRS